jgi:hypothetical protein
VLGASCAQGTEGGDGPVNKGTAAVTKGGGGRLARATLTPPASWASRKVADWSIHTASDGLSVFAQLEVGAGNGALDQLNELASIVGATEVRMSDEQAIAIGADKLPARAADGVCKLGEREARVQYALVDMGEDERVMLAHIVVTGAPDEVGRAAQGAIASLRRKQ